MENRTLESYFIEDYERVKCENERMRDRLRKLENNEHDFGITDLHQKYQAVKGSTCSKWVVKDYLLKNGKMTPERMREVMGLSDGGLFEKFREWKLNYYDAISYEEHEFQYTLHIRESRDEWTAITDGKLNDRLLKIVPRELGEDLAEDEWYPIGEADAVKAFLAQNLRETMEKALDEYEAEQRAEEDSDGSAS